MSCEREENRKGPGVRREIGARRHPFFGDDEELLMESTFRTSENGYKHLFLFKGLVPFSTRLEVKDAGMWNYPFVS